MAKVSEIQTQLADREAIRDCIYRYCRAIDRCDFELLASVYWPEATEDHQPFKGSAKEFVDWAKEALRPMDQTQHLVANILISIDDDTAYVETYVRAHHRLPSPDGSRYDLVTSGRYLDVMKRRSDEWRILARTVVRDWFRQYPDSADWETGVFGIPFDPGKRTTEDPSYSVLRFGGNRAGHPDK
jgi:ketosteroid isomerase-like protein